MDPSPKPYGSKSKTLKIWYPPPSLQFNLLVSINILYISPPLRKTYLLFINLHFFFFRFENFPPCLQKDFKKRQQQTYKTIYWLFKISLTQIIYCLVLIVNDQNFVEIIYKDIRHFFSGTLTLDKSGQCV